MPNIERKWSDYTYDLSSEQLDGLLTIARNQDRPIGSLVLEAIDQYIEREMQSCRTETP
jgi:hypothetical protein